MKEIWIVSIPSCNFKGLPLKDYRAFDDYQQAKDFIEKTMNAAMFLSKIPLYEKQQSENTQ